MGAVIVLAPAMMAAWPVVSSSVIGAATAMGFAQLNAEPRHITTQESVELEIEAGVVAESMAPSERLIFQRDDLTITFARDARGKCQVHAHGSVGAAQLEALGNEFAEEVVQQYAYNVLVSQLDAQGFNVVEQEVTQDQTIHVTVRRF